MCVMISVMCGAFEINLAGLKGNRGVRMDGSSRGQRGGTAFGGTRNTLPACCGYTFGCIYALLYLWWLYCTFCNVLLSALT